MAHELVLFAEASVSCDRAADRVQHEPAVVSGHAAADHAAADHAGVPGTSTVPAELVHRSGVSRCTLSQVVSAVWGGIM